MQASFPNPCDRAVHRREPLRNPARRLLPCWIGLRDSSNTAVVSLPLSSPPGPGLSAKDIALQNILRAAHVGHYFSAFQRKGVLLEMLPTLEFAELRTAFNFTLKQWRDLQLAMKNARALVAATPSCHEAQLAPTIVLQRPVFRPIPRRAFLIF